ncbi:MAG: hypothetical protein AAFZ15_30825 [Bacteroidota bacterium]
MIAAKEKRVHSLNGTPVQGKTAIETIADLSQICEERLKSDIAYYRGKKVNPKGMEIPGIDTTRGGINIPFEQIEAIEQKLLKIKTEKDFLWHVLSSFKVHLLPLEVFVALQKAFGMFVLEPSGCKQGKTKFWYLAPSNSHNNMVASRAELLTSLANEKQYSLFSLWGDKIERLNSGPEGYLLFIALCFLNFLRNLGKADFGQVIVKTINEIFLYGALFMAFALILAGLISWFDVKNAKEKAEQAKTDRAQLLKNLKLRDIVPSLTLTSSPTEVVEQAVKRRTQHTVLITIPQPEPKNPEHDKVFNAMQEVHKAVYAQNNKDLLIRTVVDENAIGFTFQPKDMKAARVREMMRDDPGLIVIYGDYVAVIPETFYHVSEMEEEFLKKAYEVATNWDARTYLSN